MRSPAAVNGRAVTVIRLDRFLRPADKNGSEGAVDRGLTALYVAVGEQRTCIGTQSAVRQATTVRKVCEAVRCGADGNPFAGYPTVSGHLH